MGLFNYIIDKYMVVDGRRCLKKLFSDTVDPRRVNEKRLFDILRLNKNSEYGKKYGFKNIHSVEQFRKQVPIVEYKDIEKEIERIYYNAESNVLASGKVIGFALSSGSVGKPKIIPKTENDIKNYTGYTINRSFALADEYMRKTSGRGLKPARGLFMLLNYDRFSPHGLRASNVVDITSHKYYICYPSSLVVPLGRQYVTGEIDKNYALARFSLEERNLLFIFYVFSKGIAEFIEYIKDNWESLVDEIEKGTINPDVEMKDYIREKLQKVAASNPVRAAELRREFAKGFDETILKRIWPNLSFISAIGSSAAFQPFTEAIKSYSKDIPFDYFTYASSEGIVGVSCKLDDPGQLLLPGSCYYEFIEEGDETQTIHSIDELKLGKDYEIIMTNSSGFYRYRINDVLRVVGFKNKCPIVLFMYRKGQLLNITGEKTNIEQMNEAVKRLEKETGVPIKEWTVYVDKGKDKYRYAIVLETENGDDLSGYSEAFDRYLIEINDLYEQYKYMIDSPLILAQKPGTHEAWKQKKIASGATVDQVKPVKILDTEEKKEFFLSRLC